MNQVLSLQSKMYLLYYLQYLFNIVSSVQKLYRQENCDTNDLHIRLRRAEQQRRVNVVSDALCPTQPPHY